MLRRQAAVVLTPLPEPASSAPARALARATQPSLFRRLAPQDHLVLAYLLGLNVGAATAQPHSLRPALVLQMLALLTLFGGVVFLVRSGRFSHPLWAAFTYRATIFFVVALSYFLLGDFLPAVNPGSLDRELYALGQATLGGEPALWFDSILTPRLTEWFAFFYFAYFYLIGVHIFPILFLSRHPRLLGEFGMGMLLVYCLGQTLYRFVPGWGPHLAIAGEFSRPLEPGFWLDAVMAAVHSGGAQKDIFPSLHTAAPLFLALFSYRHRHTLPFSLTWPAMAFVATNTMLATMALRWHWVVDVIAGTLLASFALWLSVRSTDAELKRRAALGLSPAWLELPLPRLPSAIARYFSKT